ncbi:MAG: hypothetical protein M3082_12135 [Candidatus Dormibacteraeota bacterium]|nr:hypothetical protein [Candidatus Dormibacteraeota bacterium]
MAFSSYTCSLEFVHEVGYWDKDVIPEDSRFYWKAFFRFGERFQVKTVWLPIYGDSPAVTTPPATPASTTRSSDGPGASPTCPTSSSGSPSTPRSRSGSGSPAS